MDDGVWGPILCRFGGVFIIIKDGLNASLCPGDLDSSGVDGVLNSQRPAASGFHNEVLTQYAASWLQGHNKLLQSGWLVTCKDMTAPWHGTVTQVITSIPRLGGGDYTYSNK